MPTPRTLSLQDEVQTALESFFRVGEAGGKTLDRFDELMKVGRFFCVTEYIVDAHHAAAAARTNCDALRRHIP